MHIGFLDFDRMEEVRGVFGDPHARIITLVRRSKEQPAARAEENILFGDIADRSTAAAPAHVEHTPASLYEAFPPDEARRLVERFEWHHTP
jgi:hypothetical protein